MFRRARKAVDGGNVADGASPPREHVLGDALSEEKLRPDVDVIQAIELLRGHGEKRLVEADSRIVHETVNTAEKSYCLGTQPIDLFDPVEIRGKSFTPLAHRPNLLHRRSRAFVLMGVMHRDIRALPGKLQCDLAPNARAGAGNEHPLA